MPEFAKIESGVVVQVIVADQSFVNGLSGTWVSPNGGAKVGIGHRFSGALFVSALPAALSLAKNTRLGLSVSVASPDSATYQWKKNGSNIGGATNAVFEIASLVPGDAGDYTCLVTAGANSIEVGPTALTVT